MVTAVVAVVMAVAVAVKNGRMIDGITAPKTPPPPYTYWRIIYSLCACIRYMYIYTHVDTEQHKTLYKYVHINTR